MGEKCREKMCDVLTILVINWNFLLLFTLFLLLFFSSSFSPLLFALHYLQISDITFDFSVFLLFGQFILKQRVNIYNIVLWKRR